MKRIIIPHNKQETIAHTSKFAPDTQFGAKDYEGVKHVITSETYVDNFGEHATYYMVSMDGLINKDFRERGQNMTLADFLKLLVERGHEVFCFKDGEELTAWLADSRW